MTAPEIPGPEELQRLSAAIAPYALREAGERHGAPTGPSRGGSPAGAGTKIRWNPSRTIFGCLVFDPAFRVPNDVVFYNTQRTAMSNALEFLVAYYAGEGPTVRVMDWGVYQWIDKQKAFVNLGAPGTGYMQGFPTSSAQTPSGVLPCYYFLNGWSPSEHRGVIYVWADGKWKPFYKSPYQAPSSQPQEGSEGYSQLEAWFPPGAPPPPIPRVLGTLNLQIDKMGNGHFTPFDQSVGVRIVDPYFQGYRTVYPETDMANWGYVSR
jgi:hypothetical protein